MNNLCGPIRVTLLTSGQIPPGTQISLSFKIGHMREHPIYGSDINMEGEIPFILSSGEYPFPKYFEMSKKEQDTLLEETVKRLRHLHEEMDEEELRTKYLGWIIFASLVWPKLDPQGKVFQHALSAWITSFRGDDMIDDEGIEFDSKIIFKRRDLWERMCSTGEFELCNELLRYCPPIEKPFRVLMDAFGSLADIVPNFRQNVVHLLRLSYYSFQLIQIANKPNGKENVSEEAMKVYRRLDSGGEMTIEWGTLFEGVSIPQYVRDTLLFQMLMSGIGVFGGLLNDILGVGKDIQNEATNLNVILRKVARGGMKFEEVFRQELQRLQHTSHDIKIISKKILDAFPEEEGVADFIRICLQSLDGQLYAYKMFSDIKLRYGISTLEIVPTKLKV